MTNHELAAKLLGCEVEDLQREGLVRSEELPVLIESEYFLLVDQRDLKMKRDSMIGVRDRSYPMTRRFNEACPNGAVVIG